MNKGNNKNHDRTNLLILVIIHLHYLVKTVVGVSSIFQCQDLQFVCSQSWHWLWPNVTLAPSSDWRQLLLSLESGNASADGCSQWRVSFGGCVWGGRGQSQTSLQKSRCRTGVPNFHLSMPAPESRHMDAPQHCTAIGNQLKRDTSEKKKKRKCGFTMAICAIIYHGAWCPTDRPHFVHQWDRGTGVTEKEHYCVLTLRECLGGCCHTL